MRLGGKAAVTSLDPGISRAVEILQSGGVETFESCEGGEGHSYPEPTVCFFGGKAEGYRALSIAMQFGLRVSELRRYWTIEDGEPVGPRWQMTFIAEPTLEREGAPS